MINYAVSLGYPNSDVADGAGNALKSCRQIGSPLEGCNTSEHPRWGHDVTHHGFDEFGFSALPGGTLFINSIGETFFTDLGHFAGWWSASDDLDQAYSFFIDKAYGHVFTPYADKQQGLRVRCVRDYSVEDLIK